MNGGYPHQYYDFDYVYQFYDELPDLIRNWLNKYYHKRKKYERDKKIVITTGDGDI